MSEDIPKKVIDITGVELMPGDPVACLVNGNRALSVAATSAITICFAFPCLIL